MHRFDNVIRKSSSNFDCQKQSENLSKNRCKEKSVALDNDDYSQDGISCLVDTNVHVVTCPNTKRKRRLVYTHSQSQLILFLY